MYLPMQREPVQRSLVGAPAGNQSQNSATRANGADAGNGVEPSGLFDDILGGIQKVTQVAGGLAPVLGSFGI